MKHDQTRRVANNLYLNSRATTSGAVQLILLQAEEQISDLVRAPAKSVSISLDRNELETLILQLVEAHAVMMEPMGSARQGDRWLQKIGPIEIARSLDR